MATVRRTNVPVELSEAARKVVEADVRRLGASRRVIVERLLLWYSEQSDAVRGSIIGSLPPSLAVDVSPAAMEQLAKRSGKR